MIKDRPCGACGALVPAESGCDHWKPRTKATNDAKRRAKTSPRIRTSRGGGVAHTVEEFQRIMRRGYR